MNSTRPTFPVPAHVGLVEFTDNAGWLGHGAASVAGCVTFGWVQQLLKD